MPNASRDVSSTSSEPEPRPEKSIRPVVDFATGNVDYLSERYDEYLSNPASLDPQWQAFFAGFTLGLDHTGGSPATIASADLGTVGSHLDPDEAQSTLPGHLRADKPVLQELNQTLDMPHPVGIYDLVHTYREFGHFEASLDPLAQEMGVEKRAHPMLSLENFGLYEADLDSQLGLGGFLGPCDGTVGDLVAKLRRTYCGTIGVEFTGITDKEQRDWLQSHMEPTLNHPQLSPEQKKHILRQLIAAEEFEQYLHRAFVGSKRFSIEGAEAVVPLMNTIVESAGDLGGEQIICAMAHRGRLNVLAHVLEKPYETMLAEFAGTNLHDPDSYGDGDVKYHLGFANTRRVKSDKDAEYKTVKVSLLPNPSHLELINPIQQGIIRAKQEWMLNGDRGKVVPICLHGDAAFTGQGVVAETLNLSELKGYRTGGTIHVIVNNQIGFTTPPHQGRFTPYPTDIAKTIQAPVFHVNGDDPEAVFHVSKLAIGFRQRFRQDVMIDLWCYRRYGHNEQDEPSFTQPLMYKAIKRHKSVREIYAKRLLDEGTVTEQELATMREELLDRFKASREQAQIEKRRGKVPSFSGVWKGLGRAPEDYNDWEIDTRVSRNTLEKVMAPLSDIPSGFTVHPKLKKMLQGRVDAVASGQGIDWGTGEMLALGSLLLENTNVRFTGQDVERGTFSHRHQVLHDYNDGSVWRPLQHIGGGAKHENQGKFEIINTMLSEEAVLAFEWGFSSADPRNLVIWEAQFGDFVNGAQNLIDQILAAAEGKWRYMNGIVLNLPHGYEGQGPEHSNAYLERWLSLCADNNMQVAVPTTPAQYFHMLRRQIERPFRKPLILMMPKSLLRKPEASSSIEEFTERRLQLVIDDPELAADKRAEKVRRVILCSGKVYYTLEAARKEKGRHDVALVRVEQLYPFPETQIRKIVERYRKASEIFWTQEEPQNRGAWSYIHPRLREMFPDRLVEYRGREAAASPATGSPKMHALEEAEFVADALASTGKSATAAV